MLPVDVILGIPAYPASQSRQEFSRRSVENLQLAYEIARRNLQERAVNQADVNVSRPFPSYQPRDQVLVHRPYSEADGPNPKLISSWRGPFVIRSRLSPVIYRVSKGNQPEETPVHLARTATDFDSLDDLFLGIKILLWDFDNSASQVRIGKLTVNAIENHKRAPNFTGFRPPLD